MVVLKRLSDALPTATTVLAVIRGTAVNQDGREQRIDRAQRAVAGSRDSRGAGERRASTPAEIGYVEAHGTGTSLGDPDRGAGPGGGARRRTQRRDAPLWIGSVKTNIGHLEAAAGIAGLIKVVLALRHRTIPPHLHLTTPTRSSRLGRAAVAVPTAVEPGRADRRPPYGRRELVWL